MPDTKRFTTIFDLIDNFTARYEKIKKQTEGISNKTYGIKMHVDSGIANKTEGIIKRIGSGIGEVGNTAEKTSSKVRTSFNNIRTSVNEFQSSIQNAIQSLAAFAIGGGIAGFSWLDSAKAKLFEEQTERAIASNRKLKLSQQDVAAFVEKYQGAGWTTTGKMTETLQAASLYGAKYGFKGEKLGGLAASAEQVAFAKQEALGGMTGGELVRMSTQIKGKLRGDTEFQFRAATSDVAGTAGYENLIKTARGRLKLLQREAEKGGEGGTALNMQVELDKRPRAEAMNNINDLKRSVGDSIGGPMRSLTKMFADLAKGIKNIPGGSAFIGYAAIFVAVAGGAGLLLNIMSPLLGIFKAVHAAMIAHKAVAASAAIADSALAATQGQIGVAMLFAEGPTYLMAEAEASAATGAWAMAGGLWAAIAPLLLIVVPLVALGALLYLVEQKTHIFSKALKELGKTQMAKDFFNWFKDAGYWINQAIKWLDNLYKVFKASGQLKATLDIVGSSVMVLLKPMLLIVDFISKILHDTDAIKKLFEFASYIWKKLLDVMSVGGSLEAARKRALSWQEENIPFFKEFEDWVKSDPIGKWIEGWKWPTLPEFSWPTLPSVDNIFNGLKTAVRNFVDWINGILATLAQIPGNPLGIASPAMEPIGKSKEGFDIIPTQTGFVLRDKNGNTIGSYAGNPESARGQGLGASLRPTNDQQCSQ